MSDTPHLDPEANHTVMQMLEGGVRVQPLKISADDALAWAKKAKVDLSVGDKEALINSARVARNLPPYKIIEPPTPAPLAATSRDGQPSVAAAQQAHEARPGDVAMRVATDWAKSQRIVWDRVTPKFIDQINEERKRLGMPKFRIKPTGICTPIAPPVPVVSNVACGSPVEPRTWSGLPTTEADLLSMATSFDGLVSGMVTPELAGWMLNLNSGNRPLMDSGVARFVEILQRGRWILTGEPLIVSTEAVVNDGQHRLAAIVKSGIAAPMDIRFGISREAFTSTGTGMRRTNGQILAIAGRPYSSMQGALCRLLVHYERGDMAKLGDGIEGDLAVQMTEDDPNIGRIAALLRAVKLKPIKNANFGFVLLVASRGLSYEKAEEFAQLVDSGQGDQDSPPRKLNNRLVEAALAKSVRMKPIDVSVMTVLAWNAWIEKRQIQVLRVHETHRSSDKFPKIIFE